MSEKQPWAWICRFSVRWSLLWDRVGGGGERSEPDGGEIFEFLKVRRAQSFIFERGRDVGADITRCEEPRQKRITSGARGAALLLMV